MDSEWYLVEYEKKSYLHNKTLSRKMFYSPDGTHDHCEICWARFSKYPGDLQEGYYESKSQSWICPDCYNELAPLFGWILKQSAL